MIAHVEVWAKMKILTVLALCIGGTQGFAPLPARRLQRIDSSKRHIGGVRNAVHLRAVTAGPEFQPGFLLAAGAVTQTQAIGYFVFLGVLILVPFVGGSMDTLRIAAFREKRDNFIEAIEEEIVGLKAEGTESSLQTAQVK